MKNYYRLLLIVSLIATIFPGCVERYDTPPAEREFEYGTIVPIATVKALYDTEREKEWFNRTPFRIEDDWAITGIVTGSDKKDGNLYKEGYIEDQSSGILLKFESTGGFYLGDSVIINLKDLYLGDYGDFIQVGDIPYTDASGNYRVSGFNKDERMLKVSVGNPSHPTMASIAEIKSDDFLGRLVKLTDVQFSGSETGKTYADIISDPPVAMNRDLEDCSGDRIIVRTSGYATFAGATLPAGSGTIIGIVTKFNTDYQIIIRDISEVEMDGERCVQVLGSFGTPVETISQDFESFSDDQDINTAGWQNYIVSGGRYWRAQYFATEDNTYAQSTGYNSGVAEMETWLITPPVTISAAKTLTFRSAMAYWTHEAGKQPLEVLFSTDYDGTNLATASWTSLTATLPASTGSNYAWVASGDVALPVSAGQAGVIAFRYRGSNTESTSSIIDDIVVTAAK